MYLPIKTTQKVGNKLQTDVSHSLIKFERTEKFYAYQASYHKK